MSYTPKFSISTDIVNLVGEISELTGRIGGASLLSSNPELRRVNRIKTIQGTLAIEQNTMSLNQVTALLNGKHVLAPAKDILEVRNACKAYEALDSYDPYSPDSLLHAHGILMTGLVDDPGEFRSSQACVVDSDGNIIHFGTLPRYVPQLMEDLFFWLKESNDHPLIKSCVFHFEFENIHPFLDGNGRTGRLWHTLLLSRWNPIFSWLPVESIVHNRQQEYYQAINISDAKNDSSSFIEFMLSAIRDALREAAEAQVTEQVRAQVTEQVDDPIIGKVRLSELLLYCSVPRSRQELQDFCQISSREHFRSHCLAPLLSSGQILPTIPEKPTSRSQKYIANRIK